MNNRVGSCSHNSYRCLLNPDYKGSQLCDGVITRDELCALISQARQAGIRLILTGNVYPDYLDACVDEVTKLQTRYE